MVAVVTTLTRTLALIDGRPANFASIDDAAAFYAALNMRELARTDDEIVFGAQVVETQTEGKDGVRTWHDMFMANLQLPTPTKTKAARERGGEVTRVARHATTCAVCGAARDPECRMARCKPCFLAYGRQRYNDERIGALRRAEARKRYHRKKEKGQS